MTGVTPDTILAELRQLIAAAGLATDTGEAIASYLAMIERQLSRPNPNQTIIQNNLNCITDLLCEQPLAEGVETLRRLLQPGLINAGVTASPGRESILTAGEGGVVIGGNAEYVIILTNGGNTITRPADQVEPLALLRGYYRLLAQDCQHLPLGVVDPRFVQPGRQDDISLAEVYTDLDVVSAPRAENETEQHWGLRLARGEGGERVPLLKAITEERLPRLVLIGEAGSGKTTFVNYLGYCLAAAIASGQASSLPDLLQGQLPVRLILRQVVRCLPAQSEQGSAGVLWNALHLDITEVMGSRKGDTGAQKDELGNPAPLTIDYSYWLARYPVTVAQFQCFIKDSGYEESAWWTPTGWGWDWRQGRWDSRDKKEDKRWARDRIKGFRVIFSLANSEY
jgi:hypothetical protein